MSGAKAVKRVAMMVAIGIASGLMIVSLLIRGFENHFIYFPPRPHGDLTSRVGLDVEEIALTAADGTRLNACLVPHAPSPQVLLWFHGNAEDIGLGFGQLKMLATLGVNVMELDYRGYGKSEGSPDETGLYLDAEAAYKYLVDTRRFAPRDIILYGNSLGGAVATDLASRHECGGLIVESTFTSARDMARQMFRLPVFAYVIKSRFQTVDKIRRVRAPVLIIHGTRDDVVPFAMSEALYEAAHEPKRYLAIKDAGHNDVAGVGGEAYLQEFRQLIGTTQAPDSVPHGRSM